MDQYECNDCGEVFEWEGDLDAAPFCPACNGIEISLTDDDDDEDGDLDGLGDRVVMPKEE